MPIFVRVGAGQQLGHGSGLSQRTGPALWAELTLRLLRSEPAAGLSGWRQAGREGGGHVAAGCSRFSGSLTRDTRPDGGASAALRRPTFTESGIGAEDMMSADQDSCGLPRSRRPGALLT